MQPTACTCLIRYNTTHDKDSDFDHSVWFLPQVGGCSWAGVASLRGEVVSMLTSSVIALAHELGHNFGMLHSHAFTGRDPGVDRLSWTDVMGGGDHFFALGRSMYADWVTEDELLTLGPTEGAEEFNLTSLSLPVRGIHDNNVSATLAPDQHWAPPNSTIGVVLGHPGVWTDADVRNFNDGFYTMSLRTCHGLELVPIGDSGTTCDEKTQINRIELYWNVGRQIWYQGVYGEGQTFYTAGHSVRVGQVDAAGGWAVVTITPGHEEVEAVLGRTVTLGSPQHPGMALAAQSSAICKSGTYDPEMSAANPIPLYSGTNLSAVNRRHATWRIRDASHVGYGNVALELESHPGHHVSCPHVNPKDRFSATGKKCELSLGEIDLDGTFLPTRDPNGDWRFVSKHLPGWHIVQQVKTSAVLQCCQDASDSNTQISHSQTVGCKNIMGGMSHSECTADIRADVRSGCDRFKKCSEDYDPSAHSLYLQEINPVVDVIIDHMTNKGTDVVWDRHTWTDADKAHPQYSTDGKAVCERDRGDGLVYKYARGGKRCGGGWCCKRQREAAPDEKVWLVHDSQKTCGGSQGWIWGDKGKSLEECKAACLDAHTSHGCVSVDYYPETTYCSRRSTVCTKFTGLPGASYRYGTAHSVKTTPSATTRRGWKIAEENDVAKPRCTEQLTRYRLAARSAGLSALTRSVNDPEKTFSQGSMPGGLASSAWWSYFGWEASHVRFLDGDGNDVKVSGVVAKTHRSGPSMKGTVSDGMQLADAADIVGGTRAPHGCTVDYALLNTTYVRHEKTCVYKREVAKYAGKSVDECARLCDKNEDCTGFEYGVESSVQAPVGDADGYETIAGMQAGDEVCDSWLGSSRSSDEKECFAYCAANPTCRFFSHLKELAWPRQNCFAHESCTTKKKRTGDGPIDIYTVTLSAAPQPKDCQLLSANTESSRNECPDSNTDLHLLVRPDPCGLHSCCLKSAANSQGVVDPERRDTCGAMLAGLSVTACRENPSLNARAGCHSWEQCRVGKVWVGERAARDGDFILGITTNGEGSAVQSVKLVQPFPASRAFSLRLEGYAQHPETGLYRWVELGRATSVDSAEATVTVPVSRCSKTSTAKATVNLCNATYPAKLLLPCTGPVCTHEYTLSSGGSNVSHLASGAGFVGYTRVSSLDGKKCEHGASLDKRAPCANGEFGSCGQMDVQLCAAECEKSPGGGCTHFSHLSGEGCILCKEAPSAGWNRATTYMMKANGSPAYPSYPTHSETRLQGVFGNQGRTSVHNNANTWNRKANTQPYGSVSEGYLNMAVSGAYSFSVQFAGAAELWIELGSEPGAKIVKVVDVDSGAGFVKGTATVALDAGHLYVHVHVRNCRHACRHVHVCRSMLLETSRFANKDRPPSFFTHVRRLHACVRWAQGRSTECVCLLTCPPRRACRAMDFQVHVANLAGSRETRRYRGRGHDAAQQLVQRQWRHRLPAAHRPTLCLALRGR